MDPTDGRITGEEQDLAACLFDPLSFIPVRIFFQADTGLKSLLRSLSGFQKESDDSFGIRTDLGSLDIPVR